MHERRAKHGCAEAPGFIFYLLVGVNRLKEEQIFLSKVTPL